MVLEIISGINQAVSSTISAYLPDGGIFSIIKLYPLYVLAIFFVLTAGIGLFFDFIKDAWKIPIAIIGDIIDLMAMQFPGVLDIVAAVYSALVFYILAHSPEFFRKLSTAAVFCECIIGINFPIAAVGNLGYLTNVLPTNTILMFIGTIID